MWQGATLGCMSVDLTPEQIAKLLALVEGQPPAGEPVPEHKWATIAQGWSLTVGGLYVRCNEPTGALMLEVLRGSRSGTTPRVTLKNGGGRRPFLIEPGDLVEVCWKSKPKGGGNEAPEGESEPT